MFKAKHKCFACFRYLFLEQIFVFWRTFLMFEVSINLIPCQGVTLNFIYNYFPKIDSIVCVNENPVLILNCFTGKAFFFYNVGSWWNNRPSFRGGDCRVHCFLILNNKTEQFSKRLGNRRVSQTQQHLQWSSLWY